MEKIERVNSIEDLFDTIDNVSKSNEDNDKIIHKIKEKITLLYNSWLNKKEEKKKIKTQICEYKAYLKEFQDLIEKQMAIIDSLFINDDIQDMPVIFLNLQKEFINYTMQIYKLNLTNMSEILNQKQQNIYHFIHIYDFFEKYFTYTADMTPDDKSDSNNNILPLSSNWKTYYYLLICLEKQREYNQIFISYYMSKNIEKNKEQIFIKKSNFYAADFQGQLSKNIYYRRKQLKLTQQQLSERSGVDRTMIAKIEKVKQPTTLETAIKLLSSLDMGVVIYPFAEIENKSLI